MDPEHQEEEQDFNIDMFATDKLDDNEAELEQELIDQFPDYSEAPKTDDEIAEEQAAADEAGKEKPDGEKNEDDPNKLNFSEEEDEDGKKKGEDEDEFDLASLNKKFDKDFKSEQEFKDFLKGKEETETASKDDENLELAENQLTILNPLIELTDGGGYKIDDEALMRRQFESIAMQNKQDLNDEDVKIEIEEKVQTLVDKGVLNLQADSLRGKIQAIVKQHSDIKNGIVKKREDAKTAETKLTKENLQNEFAAFHGLENFYGVKLDNTIVEKAYKNAVSGKFIESLQSDKKAMAEFAIIAEIKENIFKKASGQTYSDGIKTVVDEFKANKKEDTGITKAQQRGTAASAEGSKGLINSILYEKPKEEDKK